MKIPERPDAIESDELRAKLHHMEAVLRANKYDSLMIKSEGAMRWLTGMRHQVGDISPGFDSPAKAVIRFRHDESIKISIISSPYEMPRLKDMIPPLFEGLDEIDYEFLTETRALEAKALSPEKKDYATLIDSIVRPLLGGFEGNQYRKLDWLSNATMRILADTAYELIPGMDGQAVRGLLIANLARAGIEANVILIALTGQEKHLHPIPSSLNKVVKDSWIKLVAGTRYSEHIVSESLMVKIGGSVSELESLIYAALQDASVEYADCYRENSLEKDIHRKMRKRFSMIEKKYDLKGFGESAVLHHPGGGTSPLGNRDWMLKPEGKRKFEAWTQFAINPVDCLANFKVELQGIIQSSGQAPRILDMNKYISPEKLSFREVKTETGITTYLPNPLAISIT
jgi:hypothetical protein